MLIHCCSEPPAPQGYGQWIALELRNSNPKSSGISMFITNIHLDYGKLYDGKDMDNEVDPNSIIGTEIKPGNSYTVYSCGRESSPTGTEGTVTLAQKKDGGDHISDIYWNCPWGTKNNVLKDSNTDENWLIQVPYVPPDGSIGNVTVKFVKTGD